MWTNLNLKYRFLKIQWIKVLKNHHQQQQQQTQRKQNKWGFAK